MSGRTLLLTVVTLLAFASNSVLCRLALAGGEIDAASFTFYRLGAGAVFLWMVIVAPNRELRAALSKSRFHPDSKTKHAAVRATFGSWQMGFLLFAYAVCFSFAYLSLSAATGGLILFGCVQATMIIVGLVKGERPSLLAWVGLVVAVSGLVYLFLPKLEAPSLVGGSLMAVAGVSWGFYSLLGRGVPDASLATAGNFVRSVPFTILLALAVPLGLIEAQLSTKGVLLAVVSGAITSGLGYVVWYHALKGLTATRAAVVQLAVPVVVALGGVAFIGEPLTLSLVVSGALILGGIAIVIAGRKRPAPQ